MKNLDKTPIPNPAIFGIPKWTNEQAKKYLFEMHKNVVNKILNAANKNEIP